ncbi:MAG: hypothetical protein ACD_7C00171G0004 [uncultured bacterium]|nr:MAG: hypothetical protein ACD_7C00171G0004 [uncultured bacterium]HBR79913.1 hypothetical protein [Candidatus Moranbacteria bacterium]
MEEQNIGNNVGESNEQDVNSNLNQNVTPINPTPQAVQLTANIDNAPQIKYAEFFARAGAFFTDIIIVMIIMAIVGFIVFLLTGQSFDFFLRKINHITDNNPEIVVIPFFWIYYIFMTYKFEATIGKMIIGIKVTNSDFSKMSFKRVILRETIGKLISQYTIVGYFLAIFTEKNRALHDMIAKSVVIYKN